MPQDPAHTETATAGGVAALHAEAQHSAANELYRRIAFVVETARRLHQYGTAAPRLESAIDQLSARVGLRAQVWSSPTALIVSFADGSGDNASLAEITQVMRLSPGDLDLRHLVEVNEIA
ncbi:MAG: threonine/serine exporter family protein, partial [Rudaea sp.]